MREVILPSGASWVKHGGKSGAPEAAVDSPLETWTKTCRSSTLGRLVAGVPLLLCAVLVLPRSAQADLQGSLLFGPAPPQPAYCTGGAGPTTVGIGSADGSTVYNPNVGTASGGIPSYTSGAYPTSNYYTSSWAGCSTTVTVDLLYPASWVVISFPGGVWAGTSLTVQDNLGDTQTTTGTGVSFNTPGITEITVSSTVDGAGNWFFAIEVSLDFPTPVVENGSNLGPCKQCQARAGAPINVTSGNVWVQQRDYRLPGLGGGLELARTWNSLLQSAGPPSLAGMFGRGWRSTLRRIPHFPRLEHNQVLARGRKRVDVHL